jgi:hypothetical protein
VLLLYAAALGAQQWSTNESMPEQILADAIRANPLVPAYLLGFRGGSTRGRRSPRRLEAMQIATCLGEVWHADVWASRWLCSCWFEQEPAMRRRWEKQWAGGDSGTLRGLISGEKDTGESDEDQLRRWTHSLKRLYTALRLPVQMMMLRDDPAACAAEQAIVLDVGRVIQRAGDEIILMRSYLRNYMFQQWRLLREKHRTRLQGMRWEDSSQLRSQPQALQRPEVFRQSNIMVDLLSHLEQREEMDRLARETPWPGSCPSRSGP